MLAQHLSITGERYTPPDIVNRARRALEGRIDVDPMSSAVANEIVQARRYYDGVTYDGLEENWNGHVFINPCGGLVKEAWKHLTRMYRSHVCSAAVWIGFSLEQLTYLQRTGDFSIFGSDAICFPDKRIKYLNSHLEPMGAPTHASYIAYLGRRRDLFRDAFMEIGTVTNP